jgi:hypothetical protein
MFDLLTIEDCVAKQATPSAPDLRCSDSAFAAAHPDICSNSYLVIKPETALICAPGSTEFKVFEYLNGVETEVVSGITFSSSDPGIFAIGVNSGSGSGLTEGSVVITASKDELTATADVTVLTGNCCDQIQAKTAILFDNSLSMSLAFGGIYASRLSFARAAAHQYADTVQSKDLIKLWSFSDTPDGISTGWLNDATELGSEIDGVSQTQSKTSLLLALEAAIADLDSAIADEKIIFLASDGEQTTDTDVQAVINAAASFKADGGIIAAIGLRASGGGFDLLERISTGGFFINALSDNTTGVFERINQLKNALCVGCCAPVVGATNNPELNFSSFHNWEVVQGMVNLIGNGFLDLLPGNGLYVDLAGGLTAIAKSAAKIQTIDEFQIVAGRTYQISFDVAGNNRLNVPNSQQAVRVTVRSSTANSTDPNIFEHVVALNWNDPFQTSSFSFVAPFSANVKLSFEQLVSPSLVLSGDEWHGNLLDNVKFDEVSTLTNLFSDNFDSENSKFALPGCGSGAETVIGSATALIPNMTSNTEPSGLASSSYQPEINYGSGPIPVEFAWNAFDGAASNWAVIAGEQDAPWLQYQFDNPVVVVAYTIDQSQQGYANNDFPRDWEFQGSNNGADWTTLDSRTGVAWGSDLSDLTKNFTFSNTTAYSYYRIVISMVKGETPSGGNPSIYGVIIYEIQMFGGTVTIVPGVAYSCCYNECSNSPSDTQVQDPSPLPDIETTGQIAQNYTSTKRVCVSCPDGTINLKPSTTPLVPDLYDNSQPPMSIRAEFNDQTLVLGFSIKQINGINPITAFYLIGSNDGQTNWQTLATYGGLLWKLGETKSFILQTLANYKFYRMTITQPAQNPPVSLGDGLVLSLFGPLIGDSSVCASSTRISNSQGDADNKATVAATAAAHLLLNCKPFFTSAKSFHATCPVGSLGNAVDKSATGTSFVSQSDADDKAIAAATAAANAELDCTGSNNGQRIIINSVGNATPYPSVKYVSGFTGTISKVTVALNKFVHTYPSDVVMVLLAPTGQTCVLMGHCGDAHAVSLGIDLVFDDTAGSFLSDTNALASGTFKPKAYNVPSSITPPAPIYPYGITLSVFNGLNPNGAWSLWCIDDTPLNAGTLDSWDLTIT